MRFIAAAAVLLVLASGASAARIGEPLDIAPAKLPDGVVGKAYSVVIRPTGGVNAVLVSCGNYGFDRLPKGVEPKGEGPPGPTTKSITLVGTPREPGSFIMDVCAGSEDGQNFRRVYEFKVTGAAAETADLRIVRVEKEDHGEFVQVAITLVNDGPGTARAATFRGSAPGLDATSATRGRCTESETHFSCALGDLAKGASARITVSARKQKKGSPTLIGDAQSSTRDPVPNNDRASASLEVSGKADLTVTISASPAATTGTREWVVRVRNRGPEETAFSVWIDVGKAVVEKAFPARDCNAQKSSAKCSAELAPNKRTAFTVRADVVGVATRTVTARAWIWSADTVDPSEGDNDASVVTEVR